MQAVRVVMLLLELLNLLQGKEGAAAAADRLLGVAGAPDRKSTRLNSSHL